ncbi:hypothetical protein GCM10010317_015940 [Streptomyces mirabilis]|nr:hypothetical protein GCM10010317_015940 [Streptomyces mirabilis]
MFWTVGRSDMLGRVRRRALAEKRDALRPRYGRTLRAYREVLSKHRGAAWAVIAISVAAGGAEAIGLASLVPMLHSAAPAHTGTGGRAYILVFFLCAVLAVALRLAADVLIARLTGLVERQLRTELVNGLLRLDWRGYASLRRGDLLAAVISEATQVSNGTSAFLLGSSALAVAVALAVAAGVLGGALTIGAVVFVAISAVFYRKASRVAARCQRDFARECADLSEDVGTLLHGLKYFRSGGLTQWWRSRLADRTERARRTQLRSTSASPVTRAVVEAFGAVFLGSVLYISTLGGRDFATQLMFIAAFYRVVPKLQTAQGQLLVARAQTSWWERWTTRRQSILSGADRREGVLPVPATIHSIDVRAVSVAYPDRQTQALQDVSLTFRRGRTYAIVGETGGGKSTLIDVLTGLIRPDGGCVVVDGVPMELFDVEQWQNRIALVPQEPVVLHGTIGHNIVWPADDASPEAVEAALEAAQLDEFVRSLPEFLSTSVGQHGTALSGGQRQRMGVARALYADRPVLVLDEATSALDPDTEARLLDEVITRAPSRITLFVTHRHDAARRADVVVLLREGRVAMVGSPDEVLGGSRAAV